MGCGKCAKNIENDDPYGEQCLPNRLSWLQAEIFRIGRGVDNDVESSLRRKKEGIVKGNKQDTQGQSSFPPRLQAPEP
jgi:hypothetical protein